MAKQKNKNIPALRFPAFIEEWKEKKFGEIFSFINTNSFSRAMLNYDSGSVKNIHYGDIHTKFKSNFNILDEEVPFLSHEIDKIPIDSYCKEGDLVIADASEDYKDVGKTIEIINLSDEKLVAGLHTYIARNIDDSLALGFKGYLMQTNKIRLQIMKMATGVTVLGISKGNISKVLVNLPQKEEQQKIASFLTVIDNKIQQLTNKKVLLEKYKKSIMQKLFNNEIRFKDEKGKAYPKWEEKKLGVLCSITTGKLDANAMNANGEYRFYTCAKDYCWIDKFAFDTEALLISGNGANVGYIHYYKGKFNAYQRTYVLDSFRENIIYIKYFLEKYLNKRIKNEKNEGNTPYIVISTLSEMRIYLPKFSEQQKIAIFLSALDDKIKSVNEQLQKTQDFKKSLLQQMFV